MKRRVDDDDLLDIAPGTVLAGTPYRILRRLAAGGMGALFDGEHVRLKHRRVAIKMIHPGLRGRADFVARMELEGQTLARLDHRGIVKIFDLGVTDDGLPYFVMEKLKGKDLRRILTARRYLDLPDALAIAEDVLEALAHAHREGVVHRDIKPENVFLAAGDGETATKVLDFGIAAVADERRGLTGQRFLGTCQYAAPEQLRGEPVTEKTDIYSLGCVLFELVTGRRPFPGPTMPQFVQQHLHEPPPKLSTFLAVPPALDALVGAALAKEPKDRPVSAIWFARQLHQIQQVAENVPLATANTTQETLLTAVTEGASSSPALVAAETARDAAFGSTVPDAAPPGDTVRDAPRAATAPVRTEPLDADPDAFRRARTRTGRPLALLRTEEMPSGEHRALDGTPEPVVARSSRAVTTGGGAQIDVPYAIPTSGWSQLPRSTRALVFALPVALTLIGSTAYVVVNTRREEARSTPATIAPAASTLPPSSAMPAATASPTATASETTDAQAASGTLATPSSPKPASAHRPAAGAAANGVSASAPPFPTSAPAATTGAAPTRAPTETPPPSPAPPNAAPAPAPRSDYLRTL